MAEPLLAAGALAAGPSAEKSGLSDAAVVALVLSVFEESCESEEFPTEE